MILNSMVIINQEKQMKDLINLNFRFLNIKLYIHFISTLNLILLHLMKIIQCRGITLKMWKDYSQGLGFSLTYDSPIGPIEFSVSSDLKNIKPIGSISIGYKFD